VIIGLVLIVHNDRVVTSPDQRDKQDRSFREYEQLMKAHPYMVRQETDLIIKNTYRTLMTRGMKGVMCIARMRRRPSISGPDWRLGT
jgi:DUF2075 family protein